MNEHDLYTTKLDTQELKSRLACIQQREQASHNGDARSLSQFRRHGTSSSLESSSSISRFPTFRTTHTSSTSESINSSVFGLGVVRTGPISSMSTVSAEVSPGDFSKPEIRRRVESVESERPKKEFQYYGRHANSWLFNDFSVTDTVKKGWEKLVTGTSIDKDKDE